MNRFIQSIFVLSALSFMGTSAHASSCTVTNAEKQASAWAEAFRGDDLTGIVNLYRPDAILNPTLSNAIVDNQAGREAYFTGLFATLTQRSVEFTDTRFRREGKVVVHSGHWTFKGVKEGQSVTIPARVSFVYAGKNCMIVDHHSSLFPK